jgi:hypothetical protein
MKRQEVEEIARELGAFLIYLDKGAIEAQHMDLVTFGNAIEMYTRRLVVRDVAALLSQHDEDTDEHPTNEQVLDMIRYGELV